MELLVVTDVSKKYQKLTDIDHVIKRSGMYLGSIEPERSKVYIPTNGKMVCRDITYHPSFLKLFDEIVTNSSDEARRADSKLNTIKITVDKTSGEISVLDNGGIPVVIHTEYDEYIPEMIFTNLRAGSNFDDTTSDIVAGTNGLGSSLVAIFSKSFKVETCDSKKKFEMLIENNMNVKSTPIVKKVMSQKGYTKITFVPDFALLKMPFGIDDDNFDMIKLRSYEVAACNPNIDVYFNGDKIDFNSFKDYISLYVKSINDVMYIEQDGWRVGITYNEFETQHTSYVNGIRTLVGGTHVDYIMNMIVDTLRDKIEKKTKQTIRPSDIKNNIHLFIDCDINIPKFTSQTKEKLINQPSSYVYKFELDDALCKKLINGELFKRIIEWAMHKKDLEDAKLVEEANKQVKRQGFHDIPKYRPATSKNREECILFLTEGDCLEENTEICTQNGNVRIKDVKIGDLVLTHNNRYKEITSKSYKVAEQVIINIGNDSVICSADHRLLVYIPNLNKFGYVASKDFTVDMKLVKSSIQTKFNKVMDIVSIEELADGNIKVSMVYSGKDYHQICTKTHAYMVYNIDANSHESVMSQYLDPSIHKLVCTME